MNINEELRKVEVKHNVEVLYCTEVGSKLFGTNHSESDSDYRFLYLPNKEDMLLELDVDHIKVGKDTKEKNTKEDVDFDGWSVQKWFKLLQKGETNSLNMLFSMFNESTIIEEDKTFTNVVRAYYLAFLNSNMKSFMGYALSQTKKFGIKGARYGELDGFVKWLDAYDVDRSAKLSTYFPRLKSVFYDCKYIKFVMAPGPKNSGNQEDIEYISVLGKLFEGNIKFDDFKERINLQYSQFGNRTKAVAETVSKTDFKALSHSYLIAKEMLELVQTNFIKYPLKDAEYILRIKRGEIEPEEVVNQIEEILAQVDIELERSNLPEKSNVGFMNRLVLDLYKEEA